jgi:hypothetical protein
MSDSSRKSDTLVRTRIEAVGDNERDSADGNRFAEEARMVTSKFSLFNHRLLTSISIVALFSAALVIFVGTPFFETNDDFTMMAITSGTAYVDKPDEHIIFSHIFIGMLLKQLYTAMPAVPWYGIYETAALFVGMSVITWLTLGKTRRPLMMIGIAFGALLVTCARPLLLIQFTTTGTILSCAGALLLMECAERFHLRKRAIACGIGSAIMFSLGAMVRHSSAQLILIITTMFIVARFLPVAIRQWRQMLTQLLAVGVVLAIVTGLTWVSEQSYQGEWKGYYSQIRATNAIREYRCDCIVSPLSKMMYKHVGWKDADVSLFFTWYSLDTKAYSPDNVKTLSKLMRDYWKENFDIGRAVWAAKVLIFDPSFLPLFLPALLLIPFRNRTKLPLASVALLSIGILALCAASIVWLKLPMRVMASVLIYCTLLAIRYLSMSKISSIFQSAPQISTNNDQNTSKIRRTIYATIILAMITPSFLMMSQLQGQLISMSRQQRELGEAVQSLSPKPDQLYVKWAWGLPVGCVGPFTDIKRLFPASFKVLPVGAFGQVPFVMNRLREFGITDLVGQLDKENVYLISNDYFNRFIRTYVAQKYEKELVLTPVPVERKFFSVSKVTFVAPANLEKFKKDWDVGIITGGD